MSGSQTYLKLLSKILNCGEHCSDDDFEKLYAIINNELFTIVNRSHFPAAAEFVKDFNALIDSIESALLFPEICSQRFFYVEGQYINTTLRSIGFLFDDKISELFKLRSVVPYFICDSEDTYIEAVNFENRSVKISFAEMKALINGASGQKIVLSRIIKFFKIHIPVKTDNACFVVGYIPGLALKHFASGTIYLDKTVQNRSNALCISSDTPSLNEKVTEFIDSVPRKTCGIYANYHQLCSKVRSHLNSELRKAQEIRTALTSDITMLETNTKIFSDMRRKEDAKIEYMKRTASEFNNIVSTIDPIMLSLSKKAGDIADGGLDAGKSTIDFILKELSDCVEHYDFEAADKCLKMLTSHGYPKIGLASKYLYCAKSGWCSAVEEEILTCAEAKMAVGISDPDKLSPDECRLYSKLIGNNAVTGRELYVRAREAEGQNELEYINLLKSSFEKGYEPAGERLLQLSEKNKKIRVYPLACHLLPEACVRIAEEDISKSKGDKRLSISGKELVYYKLAASKGYLPAIGKIVDLVYRDRFECLYQITDNSEKFDSMRSNGRTIMGLCQYLKSHSYDSMHYQEIYGIVAFCLNENPSEAMQALSGINTPAANYCKGIMYEFGRGTSRDLQQAIAHYEKALDVSKTQKALERARGKQEKERRYSSSSYNYSSSRSYSSSVSTSYSSSKDSWCFITTAACAALQGRDNCEELEILRDFRDKHINDSADGRELVLEYYRIAPLIIQRIDGEDDPDSVYRALWTDYIEPSCHEIENNNYRVAKEIYIEMVISLCIKYQVMLSENMGLKNKLCKRE